jgi:hypothetical protein
MSVFSIIRKKAVNQTVMGLLILQLLNLSVDYTDISPLAEDLSINEIESVIELVMEHVINGENNIIQEGDENDFESIKSVFSLVLYSSSHHLEISRNPQRVHNRYVTHYQSCVESVDQTIQTPPPKS